MTTIEYFQLAMGGITLVTLLILVWQTTIQNKLLQAQILKDRYDMFVEAQSPIRDDAIQLAHSYPDHYMSIDLYESRYKNDPTALHRYLYYSRLYEYLAFRYAMTQLRLPDPIGTNLQQWIADIVDDREFVDVHNYSKWYHPRFGAYVESLLSKPSGSTKPTGSH